MAVQAAEKDGVVSILKVFGEPIRGYVCWYLFSVHGGPVSCDLSAPLGRLSGAYCKCRAQRIQSVGRLLFHLWPGRKWGNPIRCGEMHRWCVLF